MKTPVLVNGAKGKMGQIACTTIRESSEFELVGELGRQDDLASSIQKTKAEIVVDLTTAEAAYPNTLTIIEQGAHPVIGTSGLLPDEIESLTKLSEQKSLGGLIIPNFSVAAVLMMQFAKEAARYLPDVEIIEAHHPGKAEAPSGTAIKTAHLIATSRTQKPRELVCKELLPGALGAKQDDVPIHAIRLAGTLAEQSVIFGQTGETLTIKHQTIDRISFMPGLMLALERVSSLNTLVYGLEKILA